MSSSQPASLYERAADASDVPRPYWLLHGAATFFAGPLRYNAAHQHGAPVLLYGLHDAFGLRLACTGWLTCRTAMIPAGVVHELDVGGNPIGVLYLEGDRGDRLAALAGCMEETSCALVGRQGDVPLLRRLFEDDASGAWAGEALDDLLAFSATRSRRPPEDRIARSLDMLGRGPFGGNLSASACARACGLSPSRFQHLFTAEVGVPFRRYRAWMRMRRAIAEIVAGSNFTMAAHAAGFADQAHFAHDFRRTFGAPASLSLKGIRR